MKSKIRRIHLTAVCGSGMGALAGMLHRSGYMVSGSDAQFLPPMGPQLHELGISLCEGYSEKNINDDIDLVIIGNAVSAHNEEVQEVLRRGIPYVSFAEGLQKFYLSKTRNIVIAGTHGKTTTTSLLSWILEAGGLDPGFMVGGIPLNFGYNFKIGAGKVMVLEGDEYNTAFFDRRPKFVHYKPEGIILTGIEFDHADIYKDEDEVYEAFRMLLPLIPQKGYLLYCSDYQTLSKFVGRQRYGVQNYGLNDNPHWQGVLKRTNEKGMHYSIKHKGIAVGEFFAPMSGNHNLQNIVACSAMAHHMGIAWDDIRQAVREFKGVKKRQEILGTVRDIKIMDDFAHHPTAVRETLTGLKNRFSKRRIIAVFEPKTQTSRRPIFQKQYPEALSHADWVVLGPVYNPYRLKSSELLSTTRLKNDLKKLGKICYNSDSYDGIVKHLLDVSLPGDLVVFMSSGDFGGVARELLRGLRQRYWRRRGIGMQPGGNRSSF